MDFGEKNGSSLKGSQFFLFLQKKQRTKQKNDNMKMCEMGYKMGNEGGNM